MSMVLCLLEGFDFIFLTFTLESLSPKTNWIIERIKVKISASQKL